MRRKSREGLEQWNGPYPAGSRETGWKIDGQEGAAAILDFHPSTLRFRIKKLGINRP